MIYSRWRADGGYDYYQTAQRHGLGDDLPVPRLNAVGPIGVPSTAVGRIMPDGAQWVGRGTVPRGLIAPLDRTGIGIGLGSFNASAGDLALLVAAALFGWWIRGQLQKELA